MAPHTRLKPCRTPLRKGGRGRARLSYPSSGRSFPKLRYTPLTTAAPALASRIPSPLPPLLTAQGKGHAAPAASAVIAGDGQTLLPRAQFPEARFQKTVLTRLCASGLTDTAPVSSGDCPTFTDPRVTLFLAQLNPTSA